MTKKKTTAPAYDRIIKEIQIAKKNGSGFVAFIDNGAKFTTAIHGVSAMDLVSYVTSVFREVPEVEIILAMKRMGPKSLPKKMGKRA